MATKPNSEFVSEFVCTQPMSMTPRPWKIFLKAKKKPFLPTRPMVKRPLRRLSEKKAGFTGSWLRPGATGPLSSKQKKRKPKVFAHKGQGGEDAQSLLETRKERDLLRPNKRKHV